MPALRVSFGESRRNGIWTLEADVGLCPINWKAFNIFKQPEKQSRRHEISNTAKRQTDNRGRVCTM